MASWYVYGNVAMHSPLVNVSVGQTLTGQIDLLGNDGPSYSYQSYFYGLSDGAHGAVLAVSGIPQLVFATIALESYYVTKIGDYPRASTLFDATNLLTKCSPAINWSTYNDTADGITISVNKQGSTDAEFTVSY